MVVLPGVFRGARRDPARLYMTKEKERMKLQ